MLDPSKCFWCGGGDEVYCAVCSQRIPCMFCNGTGELSALSYRRTFVLNSKPTRYSHQGSTK